MRRNAHVLRRLRKVAGLDNAHRVLLVKSYGALALARFQVSMGKFSALNLPAAAIRPETVEREPSAAQLGVAKQIGWAVTALAAHTPWHNTCLVQALAARRLLQRRDISCSLFLGVREDPRDRTRRQFHAWLKCGSEFITGKPGHEHYRILYRARC